MSFASSQYVKCFGKLPSPNVKSLREKTLKYLASEFQSELWHKDPVATLLKGDRLQNGTETNTLDAFGRVNGRILHANSTEVGNIIQHVKNYRSPYTDLRSKIREVEKVLISDHAGFLIGNQALDFGKQDGVTEIEESIMANEVERRMNDILLSDEVEKGTIEIRRDIAFVGCVSNFSNFLDLFRKVVRNLELGVPCVVLSRSNTTQHMYRWAELLSRLLQHHDIDPGMLSYASCKLDDIKKILASNPSGHMLITCSRDLAATIKSEHPNTIASTGGPNTLVSTELTPKISEAIRFSATIEHSGQCTALRHAIVPSCSEDEVRQMFDDVQPATDPAASLQCGQFAGIFDVEQNMEDIAESYTKHPNQQIYYRVGDELPDDGIEEYWRRVVVDVTTKLDVDNLAAWLVRNQPISLAINGDKKIARELFEKTGLVVYTVGTLENPALTCQARPQEAEVFGEFPVRRELARYTKFPVIVPSSTPSYNASYTLAYLESLEPSSLSGTKVSYIKELLDVVESKYVRGYCIMIANYLMDAVGPKTGFGSRTTLWGLQRPPINGMMTNLRCGPNTTVDNVLPSLIPFIITNARDQVQVSVDPSNKVLIERLRTYGGERVKVLEEDESLFSERTDRVNGKPAYNVVHTHDADMKELPLVGQFLSLLFPMGHIKSTDSNDQEFIDYFSSSSKWLAIAKE